MKPILILTAVLATSLLAASCNINEKEKAALLQTQQAKDDSIREAEISEVKQTDALKAKMKDSLSVYTASLSQLQYQLIQNRASLFTANDQMTQIQEFHLGRMPNDREQQIRNQAVVVQSLALQQTNIQTAIRNTADKMAETKAVLANLK